MQYGGRLPEGILHQSWSPKLEYLAVYGRASVGNYYGCAFRVLAVFRQLSTHGQKFDRESLYMSLFNLKLCTHIWSCFSRAGAVHGTASAGPF